MRASLLQVLFSIRSERQLVEHIHYNLLYRWFIGLSIDDKVLDHSTFSKNRDRLLEHDVIPELFEEVVRLAQKKKLVSKEHFSVDGTLIQAWASQKSFRPKDDDNDSTGGGRNAERDFHGETRLNETHESQTDPDARSYRKSKGAEARMAYLGHTLMENRKGLIVNAKVTLATKITIRVILSSFVAARTSRPMWLAIQGAQEDRHWMSAPRGMRVIKSASANASE